MDGEARTTDINKEELLLYFEGTEKQWKSLEVEDNQNSFLELAILIWEMISVVFLLS